MGISSYKIDGPPKKYRELYDYIRRAILAELGLSFFCKKKKTVVDISYLQFTFPYIPSSSLTPNDEKKKNLHVKRLKAKLGVPVIHYIRVCDMWTQLSFSHATIWFFFLFLSFIRHHHSQEKDGRVRWITLNYQKNPIISYHHHHHKKKEYLYIFLPAWLHAARAWSVFPVAFCIFSSIIIIIII